MPVPCQFCGKEYANTQAVKAHLKGCPDYAAHKAARTSKALANAGLREGGRGAESLGNEAGDAVQLENREQPEKPFDPVHQLRQRLAAERLRLQLREVEDAHAERDRLGEAKERERQQQ